MGGALDTPAGSTVEKAARKILAVAGVLGTAPPKDDAFDTDYFGSAFDQPFTELRDAIANLELERLAWAEALDLPGDERHRVTKPEIRPRAV
jgi:hypothetical protein